MTNPQYVLLGTVLLPPISGKRPAGGVSSETDGVPSIGGENILSNGGMTYEELKRVPYSFFKFMPKGRLLRDDVLINKDGAQTGKVGFYAGDFEEAAVNEHVFILRSRDQNLLDQHYLYYCVLLPETRNKIERRITGSAQPGLNSQFVKAVDIPFQGLTQQRKIATILTRIDTAIEKTEALIAKYQQIKAGLMHDLFTRGVLPNGQLRPPREQAPELYQETAIGWIPREWSIVSLDKIRDPLRPITYGVLKPGPYIDEGIPLLQIEDVIHGDLDFQKAHRISDALDSEYSRTKIYGGEIVVSLVGTVGRVAILPKQMPRSNLHRNLGLIAITPEQVPKFFYYYLLSWRSRTLLGIATLGSTQSLLNLANLRDHIAPTPPIVERLCIADKLDAVSDLLSSCQKDLGKLKQQKSGLMHDLLTGKVPVKVEEPEVGYG